jgi:hypothetical protein
VNGTDAALPGADLIRSGVDDLRAGVESAEALLVSIGAPRLSALGFHIPQPIANPERRLYDRLAEDGQDSAHSRYNALIRRLVSFERAAECANPRT